jgi:hypothetical protein
LFSPNSEVMKRLTNGVVHTHVVNAWRFEVPAATHCHPPSPMY